MTARRAIALSTAASALLGLCLVSASAPAERIDELVHRDELRMNFIGGGDLRSWVMRHVTEDDLWAESLRALGTFHNHMHELMTTLARHHAEELGDSGPVPEFAARISGGQWTEYRQKLERSGADLPREWQALVQVAEVMHDRVHHAMYKAVRYDAHSRAREAGLDEYLREDAPMHADAQIRATADRGPAAVSSDAFREFVWGSTFDQPRLHAAMQQTEAFDRLMRDLMTRWAEYGREMASPACRPPEHGSAIAPQDWSRWARRVDECDERHWRELVQVTWLMHERVRQTAGQLLRHYGETHGEAERVAALLD